MISFVDSSLRTEGIYKDVGLVVVFGIVLVSLTLCNWNRFRVLLGESINVSSIEIPNYTHVPISYLSRYGRALPVNLQHRMVELTCICNSSIIVPDLVNWSS